MLVLRRARVCAAAGAAARARSVRPPAPSAASCGRGQREPAQPAGPLQRAQAWVLEKQAQFNRELGDGRAQPQDRRALQRHAHAGCLELRLRRAACGGPGPWQGGDLLLRAGGWPHGAARHLAGVPGGADPGALGACRGERAGAAAARHGPADPRHGGLARDGELGAGGPGRRLAALLSAALGFPACDGTRRGITTITADPHHAHRDAHAHSHEPHGHHHQHAHGHDDACEVCAHVPARGRAARATGPGGGRWRWLLRSACGRARGRSWCWCLPSARA